MNKRRTEECDVIRLKNWREGIVLGIWGDGEAYEIELNPTELETIEKEKIEKLFIKPKKHLLVKEEVLLLCLKLRRKANDMSK